LVEQVQVKVHWESNGSVEVALKDINGASLFHKTIQGNLW
jgi:hypothetical protein